MDLRTAFKGIQSLLRQPLLPELGVLREAHPNVVVSERRKHKLFLKRARQQFGQIPQTLQTQLGAHVSKARQRVTASSYRLVSVCWLHTAGQDPRELLRFRW